MTHSGPFQPLLFCDSVILDPLRWTSGAEGPEPICSCPGGEQGWQSPLGRADPEGKTGWQ